MKDEEKEERLVSLLAARRSEAFWAAQRARITAGALQKSGPARAWLLAPAAAAAALLIVLLAKPRLPVHVPETAVSTAFLEHLDLLDDMDVLEAVSEEEL